MSHEIKAEAPQAKEPTKNKMVHAMYYCVTNWLYITF